MCTLFKGKTYVIGIIKKKEIKEALQTCGLFTYKLSVYLLTNLRFISSQASTKLVTLANDIDDKEHPKPSF